VPHHGQGTKKRMLSPIPSVPRNHYYHVGRQRLAALRRGCKPLLDLNPMEACPRKKSPVGIPNLYLTGGHAAQEKRGNSVGFLKNCRGFDSVKRVSQNVGLVKKMQKVGTKFSNLPKAVHTGGAAG